MIISSLLDNDLYKFTMMQAAFHQFPETEVSYGFKCRSGEDLRTLAADIMDETLSIGRLSFGRYELNVLRKTGLFQEDFLEYLSSFQLNPDHVKVNCLTSELQIEIKGNWIETILWEVPLLAVVSELYFKDRMGPTTAYCNGIKKLITKMGGCNFDFVDFGTRRRFSSKWHGQLLGIMGQLNKEGKTPKVSGTSNLYYADMYGLKPVGTMAHEWFQACQVLAPNLESSQYFALEMWTKEYGNKLQTALTDIFGFDAFLADLDVTQAQQYDGFRHDSGNPAIWAIKLLDRLKALGIDPKTKTVVFSDGLDFSTCMSLKGAFQDEFNNVLFGIGTNFTNDVGVKPLSIVIKMITCNGKPTAKISDSVGKIMCRDDDYIAQVQAMIKEKVSGDPKVLREEIEKLKEEVSRVRREHGQLRGNY